jgi:ABC-type amino acid transport substrate-binding protein
MAIAMTAKEFIEELTELINKELAEMPDDRTRQAVLDAFSNQMFCDTRKAQEK